MIVLFNVVPFCRLPDPLRSAARPPCAQRLGLVPRLFAGAWGNYLVVFNASLNNHTVAAYSAFFALYALDPNP